EVEVERVEEVHRRAGRVDGHLGRHLQQRLKVVEDDLDAGVHKVINELLSNRVKNGEHADNDVLVLDDLLEVAHVADQQAADGVTDLAQINIEDHHDAKAVVGEDVRAGDGTAEVPGTEERDVVLANSAQDLADLRDQRVDVVAHAALSELAE